jgi:hypothetical protein
LYGLENGNELLERIERLHIYSGPHSDEPSYVSLLTGLPWSQLLTPPYKSRTKYVSGVTEARLIEEIRLCALVARTLAMYLKGDPDLLPQLRTVSMGDIPNITWNAPMAQKTEIGMLSSSPQLGLQYKSLARFLFNLPKVAHACQATQFGPLGLSHGANRIQNPPAVFTYHPKLPSPFCPCTDALGPIILGTMNRHYYTCLYAMEDESVIMADVINNVVGSVCSTPISDTGEDLGDTADSDDLGDTMVGLYDYVRISAPTPNDWSDPIPTPRGHSAKACRPLFSLDLLQEVLDEHLPPKWRGRVIFMNREDAPPCTACGLNLAEIWEDHIEEEGVESGKILPCSQVHQ